MNKDKMKALIDSENGKGFSKNIDLSGYNFFKNNSFISFKISKVDGISVVNIKYIYSENTKDLINILAFCVNFWMGMKVKFIYYKEKKEENYAIKKLEDLGFTVLKNTSSEGVWKYEFKCIKGENPCSCPLKEAFS